MKTIYYIDSENVGDSWVSLLTASAAEDELLVFYTQNSPHMNYRNVRLLKENPRTVTFIECSEGNNALDFQLSTELGYRIRDIENDSFVIVSNDNGFDAVVRYWKKKGCNVKRITAKECSSQQLSVQPVSAVKTDIAAVSVCEPITVKTDDKLPLLPNEQAEEKKPVEASEANTASVDQNAKEILYLIGKKDLSLLHTALQQLYGTKKGSAIYNAFKTENAYNTFLSKHTPMNAKEKRSLYCGIVFSMSSAQEKMPEDFPEYVISAWEKKKNLNSFRPALHQKYGKDKGEKYYSIMKTHIKILDNIK